ISPTRPASAGPHLPVPRSPARRSAALPAGGPRPGADDLGVVQLVGRKRCRGEHPRRPRPGGRPGLLPRPHPRHGPFPKPAPTLDVAWANALAVGPMVYFLLREPGRVREVQGG